MKELEHGQKITINGRRGIVGTVQGDAKRYNEDPDVAKNRAIKNGHDLTWVNQEPAMLTSNIEYNKERNRSWENVVTIEHGEKVLIEGEELFVKFNGNYSDMVDFVKEIK